MRGPDSNLLIFRHNKGCNCKRSGCLRNYCECYEAKIPCSQYCKCVGCKNLDTETGTKVLCSPLKTGQVTLPGQGLNMTERWFKPSTSLKSKLLQANTPLDSEDKGGTSFSAQEFVLLQKTEQQYFRRSQAALQFCHAGGGGGDLPVFTCSGGFQFSCSSWLIS